MTAVANGPDAEPKRPIFLHSGFRSGSTWFWHRFRECDSVHGFCEPFNVKLAFLRAEEIADNRPDAWPSGHPLSIRPYFAEYEPLLAPGGGVRLFEPRFGVETYFQIEADPAMERYVASLVDLAQGLSKVPVLGFCCSLGRVQWFRRFADGWNIVTWRNPRDQWMSSHRQWTAYGNFHFEVHYLLVAYIARLYPELAPFFDDLGPLPSPAEIAPTMDLFTAPGGVAQRFRVFLRVFVLDMLLAIEHADRVVDLDRLSRSPDYRASTAGELRRLSGLPDLSFEDCNLPRHAFADDADYETMLLRERDFLDRLAHAPEGKTFAASLPFVRAQFAALIAGEI